MKEIKQRVDGMEASLQKLEQAETRFSADLDKALAEYNELATQSSLLDANALAAKRQVIRPAMTQDAIDRIKNAYGQHYSYDHMRQAQQDVSTILGENPEKPQSIIQQLRTAENQPTRHHRDKQQER